MQKSNDANVFTDPIPGFVVIIEPTKGQVILDHFVEKAPEVVNAEHRRCKIEYSGGANKIVAALHLLYSAQRHGAGRQFAVPFERVVEDLRAFDLNTGELIRGDGLECGATVTVDRLPGVYEVRGFVQNGQQRCVHVDKPGATAPSSGWLVSPRLVHPVASGVPA